VGVATGVFVVSLAHAPRAAAEAASPVARRKPRRENGLKSAIVTNLLALPFRP